MPRRISDYPDAFAGWNLVSSYGSIISVIATFIFLFVLYAQLVEGKESAGNPWVTAEFSSDHLQTLLNKTFDSLEWNLTSPPKPHSFTSLPVQSFFCTPVRLCPNSPSNEDHSRKDISDLEKEFLDKDLNQEYLDMPEPYREDYILLSQRMKDKLVIHDNLSRRASGLEDEGETEGCIRLDAVTRHLEQEYVKLERMQVERQKLERRAGVDYTSNTTTTGIESTSNTTTTGIESTSNTTTTTGIESTSNTTTTTGIESSSNTTTQEPTADLTSESDGKRKEREETESPGLEEKRPRLDNQSALESSEISKLLSAGSFGYFSGIDLEPFFSLIFSPYFPLASLITLLFGTICLLLPQINNKSLFKSSKKNEKS